MKTAATITMAAIGLANRLLDWGRAAYDRHHNKRKRKRKQREIDALRKEGEL